MSPAGGLIVWGGCYSIAVVVVSSLLEWNRPLPARARAVRNMAASIGMLVWMAGIAGSMFGL